MSRGSCLAAGRVLLSPKFSTRPRCSHFHHHAGTAGFEPAGTTAATCVGSQESDSQLPWSNVRRSGRFPFSARPHYSVVARGPLESNQALRIYDAPPARSYLLTRRRRSGAPHVAWSPLFSCDLVPGGINRFPGSHNPVVHGPKASGSYFRPPRWRLHSPTGNKVVQVGHLGSWLEGRVTCGIRVHRQRCRVAQRQTSLTRIAASHTPPAQVSLLFT